MSCPWVSLIAVPVEPDALNAIMHVYDGTYMISRCSITSMLFLKENIVVINNK
jgi:hypothetical protein